MRYAILALVVVWSACSDTTDPCGDTGSCALADLAVTSLTVPGAAQGRTFYSGDTLSITVVVTNRGGALRDSSLLHLSLAEQFAYVPVRLAPFKAGEQRTVVTTMVVPALHNQQVSADKVEALLEAYPGIYHTGIHPIPPSPDGNPGNDTAAVVIKASPSRIVRFEGPADLVIGAPTVFMLTIDNPAPRNLDADSLVLCVYDMDYCMDFLELSTPMPEFAGGAQIRIPVTVTIPHGRGLFAHVSGPEGAYTVRVCLKRNSEPYTNYRSCRHSDNDIWLIPNLAGACPHRVIEIGVIVMGNTVTDCAPATRWWSVWSFHAQQGEHFRVTSLGDGAVGIVDARGTPDVANPQLRRQEFTAATTGTYYVMIYGGAGAAYRVRLDKL